MNILTAFNPKLDPQQPEIISIVGGGGKSSTMFQMANEIAALGHRVLTTTTTNIGPAQTKHAPGVLRVDDDQLSMTELAELLEQHNHCLLVSPEKEATRGYKVSGISPQLVDTLAAHAGELGISAIVIEADGSHRLPIKAPADYEPVVADSTTILVPVAGLDCIGTLINEQYVHRPELVRGVLGLGAFGERDDSNNNGDGGTLNSALSRLSPNMVAELLLSPDGGAKKLSNDARLVPIVTKVDTPIRLAAARLIAKMAVQRRASLFIASIVDIGTTDIVISHKEMAEQKTMPDAHEAGPILERWGPTATVILAAGQSKRMGRPKQLEVVDGEPMVVRAARIALQGPSQLVVVVLGAYAEQVKGVLASMLPEAQDRLRFVHNPEWSTGQASSVRCAIDFLSTDVALHAALFMPVDQPFIKPLLLRCLLQQWQKGSRLVAPILDGKPRGAPALFDRTLWFELQSLSGDSGARSILTKYSAELKTIVSTERQLFDIDSPSDLISIPT